MSYFLFQYGAERICVVEWENHSQQKLGKKKTVIRALLTEIHWHKEQ